MISEYEVYTCLRFNLPLSFFMNQIKETNNGTNNLKLHFLLK